MIFGDGLRYQTVGREPMWHHQGLQKPCSTKEGKERGLFSSG